MESQKRRRIRLYFTPFPGWAGWMVLASLGLAWISGWSSTAIWLTVFPGSVGLAAIGYWSHKPSDSQMDTWIDEDLRKLEPQALAKSQLDRSELLPRPPVVIFGPRFRRLGGAEFRIKQGADRKVRFTPFDVAIINFTQHHLTIYQCVFDLTTGKALNETTSEYFYKDVVSVATESQSISIDESQISKKLLKSLEKKGKAAVNGKVQINNGEEFVLSTSGGTSVRLFLRAPILIEAAGGGEIPSHLADRAVQAVRKMLREKKAA